MRKLFAAIMMALVGLLAGCGAGPYAIKDAYLRDTIFGVELRQNNTSMVWFTHDDVGIYCTLSGDMTTKLLAIINDKKHPAEVIAHYASINKGDPEWDGYFPTGQGCNERGSSDQSATIYKLISVDAVDTSAQ